MHSLKDVLFSSVVKCFVPFAILLYFGKQRHILSTYFIVNDFGMYDRLDGTVKKSGRHLRTGSVVGLATS